MTLTKLTGSGQSQKSGTHHVSGLHRPQRLCPLRIVHSCLLSMIRPLLIYLSISFSLALIIPLEGFSACNLGLPLPSLSQAGNVQTAAFSLPSSRPQSHALPPPSHHLTRVLQSLSALRLSIPVQLRMSQKMNRQ